MTGSPPDIDGFSLDDLKILVLQLLEENVAPMEENAALGEEIASLQDVDPAGSNGISLSRNSRMNLKKWNWKRQAFRSVSLRRLLPGTDRQSHRGDRRRRDVHR